MFCSKNSCCLSYTCIKAAGINIKKVCLSCDGKKAALYRQFAIYFYKNPQNIAVFLYFFNKILVCRKEVKRDHEYITKFLFFLRYFSTIILTFFLYLVYNDYENVLFDIAFTLK